MVNEVYIGRGGQDSQRKCFLVLTIFNFILFYFILFGLVRCILHSIWHIKHHI